MSLTSAFTDIAQNPPFGTAFVLLVVQAALCGISLGCEERIRRANGRSEKKPLALHLVESSAAVVALFVPITCALAVLTLLLSRLFGAQSSFETVFSILVLAQVPAFFAWFTYPLRSLSFSARRVQQVLRVISLPFVAAIAWTGTEVSVGLSPMAALIVSVPFTGLVWAVSLWDCFERPSSLVCARQWQTAKGRSVVACFTRERDAGQVRRIVQGCDEALTAILAALDLKPLDQKVYVLLYDDKASHATAVGTENAVCRGYSHGDAISLVYSEWETIRRTVVHELAHVVREQRIAPGLYGFLDEGLAEYVSIVVEGLPHAIERPPLSTSLRAMAFHQVFYDGIERDETVGMLNASYAYARSFTTFLVKNHGLELYKGLCRQANGNIWDGCGDRLARAMQDVYGVPIEEMETRWRTSARGGKLFGKGRALSDLSWSRLSEEARDALWKADRVARRFGHESVSSEHILLGILADEGSAASALVKRMGVPPETLRRRVEGGMTRGDADPSAERRLSEDAYESVDRAFDEARRLEKRTIGTEHLLLGFLCQDQGAARTLRAAGVELQWARSAADSRPNLLAD